MAKVGSTTCHVSPLTRVCQPCHTALWSKEIDHQNALPIFEANHHGRAQLENPMKRKATFAGTDVCVNPGEKQGLERASK